jgi:Ca-activated chloride channel family protein
MATWSSGRARAASLLCFAALLASFAGGLSAPAIPAAQDQFRITSRAELVNVDVSVTDAKGNFLSGLRKEQFRVLDEGVEQPITHFSPIESPAEILLVVETSPAVYLIHRQHLAAAYLLLEGLAADDSVALASYDEALHPLLGFTGNKNTVAAALDQLHYNLGTAHLNLFDSLAAALEALPAESPGAPAKRAIVLLSTGLDESSARWEALAGRLRSSGVVVYPVALGGELRDAGRTKKDSPPGNEAPAGFERADRDLNEIARLTGGHAYFPRKPEEFTGIYRNLSSTLRHDYSLAFAPPARDARYHRLEVQVLDAKGRPLAPLKGHSGYAVRARPGYTAPGP